VGCYPDLYCEPKPDSLIDATDFMVVWSPNHAQMDRARPFSNVTLTLESQAQKRVSYERSFPGDSNQHQVIVREIEFADTIKPGEAETFSLLVIPDEVKDTLQNPAKLTLRIKRPELPTSTTTTETATETTKPIMVDKPKNDEDNLSTAAIVGIAVGGGSALLFLLIGLALILRKRKSKSSNAISESKQAMLATAGTDSHAGSNAPQSTSQQTQSSMDIPRTSQGHSNLSAGDAMLIASTYRKLMRQPSWKTSENIAEEDDEDELKREEMRNRVLLESLADEGHDLRKVSSGMVIRVEDTSPSMTSNDPTFTESSSNHNLK
jgi:hypothetical protein